MTTIDAPDTARSSGLIQAGDVELWYDQRGEGPDVLLVAGLTDPAEAWEFQLNGLAERYSVTAFDNRGAGRSPMIPEDFAVADTADDVAALACSLGITRAHVAGFSGGSLTAQELALRHPELVRSLVLMSTWAQWDAYMRAVTDSWLMLLDSAESERAMLEAFFVWIYTARAHADGTVDEIIEEALAFPHPQPAEGFRRQLQTWQRHDTLDRLEAISAPTLVIAGDEDKFSPPRVGRTVAERIPGAQFVVLPGEAHQPFQEVPDEFNALVDAFWSKVDSGYADYFARRNWPAAG
jgi:pimeloyl-ACP methyl ester carboxylesterase